MTAFYFGDSQAPLFGVFHGAANRSANAPAVLLCNPFGEEAIRSFRIFRVLADRLTNAGVSVLRFDYAGTGDSSGICDTVSLAGWQDSILQAHEELLDMSGARRAVWLGLRLGASAAILASAKRPRGLNGMILWDPILDGMSYRDEMATGHHQAMRTLLQKNAKPPEDEALGFALPQGFRNELDGLNLRPLDIPYPRCTFILGTEEHRQSIPESGNIEWAEDPQKGLWNSDQALNAYMVPHESIDMMVQIAAAWR